MFFLPLPAFYNGGGKGENNGKSLVAFVCLTANFSLSLLLMCKLSQIEEVSELGLDYNQTQDRVKTCNPPQLIPLHLHPLLLS